MNRAIVMEPTPQTKAFVDAVAEYYGYVIAIATAIGAIYATYKKLPWKVAKALAEWCKNAVQAPSVIAQMRQQMVLRDEFDLVKITLQEIRTQVIKETATRRALLQHSEKALFEADASGRLLWANAAYLMLVDRDLHEVTENNWRNSIHDNDRHAAVESWRMAVEDRTDFRQKFRIVTSTAEFWVWGQALCTRDELGNVLSFAGEFRIIDDPQIQHTS